jgi:hypothetical protein
MRRNYYDQCDRKGNIISFVSQFYVGALKKQSVRSSSQFICQVLNTWTHVRGNTARSAVPSPVCHETERSHTRTRQAMRRQPGNQPHVTLAQINSHSENIEGMDASVHVIGLYCYEIRRAEHSIYKRYFVTRKR